MPEVSARHDSDRALIAWVTHEEALFRRLKRRAVTQRLEQGFGAGDTLDVDGFLRFSLQVQNRRKSRMGRAFQLVVPTSIQASYTPPQKSWLLSLADFARLVQQRDTN